MTKEARRILQEVEEGVMLTDQRKYANDTEELRYQLARKSDHSWLLQLYFYILTHPS